MRIVILLAIALAGCTTSGVEICPEASLRIEPFAGSGYFVIVDGLEQSAGFGGITPVEINAACVLLVNARIVEVSRQVAPNAWIMETLKSGDVVSASCGNCPTLPVFIQ